MLKRSVKMTTGMPILVTGMPSMGLIAWLTTAKFAEESFSLDKNFYMFLTEIINV